MSRLRLAAGRAARPRAVEIRAVEIRAARRLAVILVLLVGAVTRGGPAGAAFLPSFLVQADPIETTLGQFTTMDITATGTDVGEHLTVTLQDTVIASGTTGAPGSGDTLVLSGVTVPSGVAACGADTVNLVFSGDVVATTSVHVYCPTVQVTPDPIDSGGAAASFTASGAGYPPGRAVSLTLDGDPNTFATVVTDGNGGFVKSADRPQLACGAHMLTATGASGQVIIQSASAVDPYPTLPASTGFEVTGCVTVPPPQPKLTANPAVFVDGTYTHVTGSGFAPGQPIVLTWQTPAGVTLTACSPTADPAPALVTDAHGGIDTVCFAPPHQILGAAQLVATQSATPGGAAVAQHAAAPVVVEGGSMQPSSGVNELIFRR